MNKEAVSAPKQTCLACQMGMHYILCEFGLECGCGCMASIEKKSRK